jgi:hypothetical protein
LGAGDWGLDGIPLAVSHGLPEHPRTTNVPAMTAFPIFRSPFLNHICQHLAVRSKALQHQGKLTWETKQPDDFEWFTVYFTPVVGHYLIFQFAEDNWVCIYIRSRHQRNRGKILLEIEDIKIIDNASQIVEAIERTVSLSHNMMKPENLSEAAMMIRAAWARLEVRVFDEG